jgi:hypothetical protein
MNKLTRVDFIPANYQCTSAPSSPLSFEAYNIESFAAVITRNSFSPNTKA